LIAADGFGTPSFAVIPPTTLGHVPNAAGYSFNPDRARQLLREAGYPNGFSTVISTFNDLDGRIAEVVQSFLADVGITTRITRVEPAVRTEMHATHQIPAFCGRWGANPDPDMVLPRILGIAGIPAANNTHFHLPELEALYLQGRSTFTPEDRIPFYQEAQRIIMNEAPWAPLYVGMAFALTRADLKGVVVDMESAKHLYLLHY
jgi:ABC-type transport system substrate-binding protein